MPKARCRKSPLVTDSARTDIRSRLMAQVKEAMKQKEALTSTVLRSVLSEIYAADKTAGQNIDSGAVTRILRKAVQRRDMAATQFTSASRQDLADKEYKEVHILSQFLPPLLSEAEIDRQLSSILSVLPVGTDPKKSQGQVYKQFYSQIDKSLVDTDLVSKRFQVLIDN
ncbi:GatB YqeY domain-containing protein [Amanita rubescens]|nr:GatB YqeY domain-containing protein [Amanita rubescens]